MAKAKSTTRAKRIAAFMRDWIEYSAKIPGEARNHHWAVSFNWHDGFVGITQSKGLVQDAVLLSPRQMDALRRFLRSAPRRLRAEAEKSV